MEKEIFPLIFGLKTGGKFRLTSLAGNKWENNISFLIFCHNEARKHLKKIHWYYLSFFLDFGHLPKDFAFFKAKMILFRYSTQKHDFFIFRHENVKNAIFKCNSEKNWKNEKNHDQLSEIF